MANSVSLRYVANLMKQPRIHQACLLCKMLQRPGCGTAAVERLTTNVPQFTITSPMQHSVLAVSQKFLMSEKVAPKNTVTVQKDDLLLLHF
jgi:hypothetical protein